MDYNFFAKQFIVQLFATLKFKFNYIINVPFLLFNTVHFSLPFCTVLTIAGLNFSSLKPRFWLLLCVEILYCTMDFNSQHRDLTNLLMAVHAVLYSIHYTDTLHVAKDTKTKNTDAVFSSVPNSSQ